MQTVHACVYMCVHLCMGIHVCVHCVCAYGMLVVQNDEGNKI